MNYEPRNILNKQRPLNIQKYAFEMQWIGPSHGLFLCASLLMNVPRSRIG